MYPRAFHYHRAGSLQEASEMLSEFGDEAKLLAGGQSLIPLMKLRYANPNHLVDLNFISGTSYIKEENGTLRFGALTRHAEIEHSTVAAKIPIIHDCAAGSAAVQLTMDGEICKDAAIVLGCVGLTAIKAKNAEEALRGQRVTEKAIAVAIESA